MKQRYGIYKTVASICSCGLELIGLKSWATGNWKKYVDKPLSLKLTEMTGSLYIILGTDEGVSIKRGMFCLCYM